jgi:hypothetical protein
MRVLALGGAGSYGNVACSILASNNLVSEIVIGGRNLEAAQRGAKNVGRKARAVSVDVADRDRVVALAKDCDIVVNVTGPEHETVLKVLNAAIAAGANYCDAGADGPTTEAALELDSVARARGVTALVGMGACPGVATLAMVHAARQLDSVETVGSCAVFPAAALGITKNLVKGYRRAGHVPAWVPTLIRWVAPPFRVYRGGVLVSVNNRADEMKTTMPGDGEIPAVLTGSPEPITIPRCVSGIQNVHMLVSWFPFQLNGMYRELGERVTRGELDWSQAALDFFDMIVAEQDRGRPAPAGFPKDGMRWFESVGTKQGVRKRYICWPTSNWYGWNTNPTSTALALASLKILRGEIRTRGVLTPGSCIEPLRFFKEVASQMTKTDEPGRLLNEAWQTL